ncbi:MAG: polysaccharide biosynthesis/export family protein [Syntrophaceae bacterium]
MKKSKTCIIIMLLLSSILIMYPTLAQSQVQKDSASPQKTQGEIATDSNQYIIGPEDVLHIYVWKEDSLTKTVPVRMDGKISLPLVDDIQAADLTPLQLKEVLIKKLKSFIDNPTVSVTVMEANSFKVFVSGEVKQPGVHRLRSETTLLQLMTMVGGFTDWADKKRILIIRKEQGTEQRLKANYKKILAGDDPDVVIKRGDTVIVP